MLQDSELKAFLFLTQVSKILKDNSLYLKYVIVYFIAYSCQGTRRHLYLAGLFPTTFYQMKPYLQSEGWIEKGLFTLVLMKPLSRDLVEASSSFP
jgi:hypothetical protein